jgi:hypothetical protein
MFFQGWAGMLATTVAGVSAYVALIVILRLSGKRTLAKMNPPTPYDGGSSRDARSASAAVPGMVIALPAGMAPRINLARTLTGGLFAGVIIIALNVVAQFALGERLEGEMNAWMAGAADRLQPTGTAAVAAGLVMKLAIGTILVWLYAVARVRLGPGPKTASLIALIVWLLAAIFFSDFPLTGMMSWTTYAMLEAWQLVAFLVAAGAGSWLYRESSLSRIDR